jgi:hypothetical protein
MLDKDLIWAFGAFMTVACIACDNADERIMKVLAQVSKRQMTIMCPKCN